MNIRSFSLFGSVAALFATFVFLPSLSAHTDHKPTNVSSTAISCDDENIPQGVTWSVKIEVHAIRNDTGKEIPRDASADITNWNLKCLRHASVDHHKGDQVHTGVCLSGDACEASERGGQAKILTPGPYHCHVISGNVICHEY